MQEVGTKVVSGRKTQLDRKPVNGSLTRIRWSAPGVRLCTKSTLGLLAADYSLPLQR
jgi:hypothetical protein